MKKGIVRYTKQDGVDMVYCNHCECYKTMGEFLQSNLKTSTFICTPCNRRRFKRVTDDYDKLLNRTRSYFRHMTKHFDRKQIKFTKEDVKYCIDKVWGTRDYAHRVQSEVDAKTPIEELVMIPMVVPDEDGRLDAKDFIPTVMSSVKILVKEPYSGDYVKFLSERFPKVLESIKDGKIKKKREKIRKYLKNK